MANKISDLQKRIYIFLIVLLVIIAFVIFLIYFTQDFKEQLTFKKILTNDDVTNVSTAVRNDVTYLRQITASIGTLALSNDGVFAQSYIMPNLRPCVKLSNGDNYYGDYNNYLIISNDLSSTDYRPASAEPEQTLPTDETRTFAVYLVYSPSDEAPLPEFYKKMKSVAIFDASEENNPFGDYSHNNYYSCSDLMANKKPIAEIPIYFDESSY